MTVANQCVVVHFLPSVICVKPSFHPMQGTCIFFMQLMQAMQEKYASEYGTNTRKVRSWCNGHNAMIGTMSILALCLLHCLRWMETGLNCRLGILTDSCVHSPGVVDSHGVLWLAVSSLSDLLLTSIDCFVQYSVVFVVPTPPARTLSHAVDQGSRGSSSPEKKRKKIIHAPKSSMHLVLLSKSLFKAEKNCYYSTVGPVFWYLKSCKVPKKSGFFQTFGWEPWYSI